MTTDLINYKRRFKIYQDGSFSPSFLPNSTALAGDGRASAADLKGKPVSRGGREGQRPPFWLFPSKWPFLSIRPVIKEKLHDYQHPITPCHGEVNPSVRHSSLPLQIQRSFFMNFLLSSNCHINCFHKKKTHNKRPIYKKYIFNWKKKKDNSPLPTTNGQWFRDGWKDERRHATIYSRSSSELGWVTGHRVEGNWSSARLGSRMMSGCSN